MRTSVNVFSCAIITAAISHWYHEELQRLSSYDLKNEESVVEKLTHMKELTEPLDPEEEVLVDPTSIADDGGDRKKKKKKKGKEEHLMEAGELTPASPKRPKSKKKRKFKLKKLKRKGSKTSTKTRSDSKKPSRVSKASKESDRRKNAGKSKAEKKTEEPAASAATEDVAAV